MVKDQKKKKRTKKKYSKLGELNPQLPRYYLGLPKAKGSHTWKAMEG